MTTLMKKSQQSVSETLHEHSQQSAATYGEFRKQAQQLLRVRGGKHSPQEVPQAEGQSQTSMTYASRTSLS